eukprot:1744393-Pyramimonas_sp.AAC.1
MSSGENVKINMAVTKINLSRNWALRKAEELIKADRRTGSQSVKADWKNRTITVNGNLVFEQSAGDLKGCFLR